MNVLVTGAAGYLGSTLTGLLSSHGHRVVAVDNDKSRLQKLRRLYSLEDDVEFYPLDLDDLIGHSQLLASADTLVHLAGISSDVVAEQDPEWTRHVNTTQAAALAQAARTAHISKFLFASTAAICQVPTGHHGESDEVVGEDPAQLGQPIGVYAQSKLAAEQAIVGFADTDFQVVVLRKGSLYGYSPIMRWDLILNKMVLRGWFDRPIVLHDFGAVWRPIAHVEDAARAYVHLIEQLPTPLGAKVLNLVERNARLSEAYLEVDSVLRRELGRGLAVEHGTSDFPQRTGRVGGDALRRTGWKPRRTFREGIADLVRRLAAGNVELAEEAVPQSVLSTVSGDGLVKH